LDWTEMVHYRLQQAESHEYGNEPSSFTESATSLLYHAVYF